MTQYLECPITRAAVRTPNNIAADLGEQWLTYAQLDRQTSELAQWLTQQGVVAGDRVAYQLNDPWSAISLFWAILRREAVACPLSTRLPSELTWQMAEQVQATQVIRDDDLQWGERLSKRHSQSHPPTRPTHAEGKLPTLALDLPATIIFSTGSAGEPKPIVHDLRSHYLSAQGSATNLPLTDQDCWLVSLPVYHVSGLSIAIRCALAGASLVIPSGTSDDLNRVIIEHQVSHVSLVTTQLKRWLCDGIDGRAIAQLKAVLLGGSGWPAELISRAWAAGLPLHTTYGLTEMASQVTTTPADVAPQHRVSSGRVLPHRELMIDPAGQILVRGETLCRGYLKDGQIVPVVGPQGWFATGDLGVLDDCGFLTVMGRRGHRFISGGENIHPEEIEAALLAQPGVTQAIVVSIADDQYGYRPVAFVEADDLAAERRRSALADALPKFKVPDFLWPWPTELVQTGVKPDRQQFQKLAQRRIQARSASE